MKIELKGLSKIYPDGTQALSGVSFQIEEGMLGLLGPNGAGKSTLLSLLVLGQEPSTGSRQYGDLDDASRNRARIRRAIGYLAQEFQPVRTLSGLEYLMLCGEIRQVPLRRKALKKRAWALLEAVELQHAAHRAAETYSGGMVRRLGLAQALIHGPRFLVVDEPTAGLDPEERLRFRNFVTDLADEIPVLLSTHIVEDIEATCPRLVVISRGRLLFDGAPGELLRRVDGRLWRLPAGADMPPGAPKIGTRSGAGDTLEAVVYAEEPPSEAEPVIPLLEEAYAAFLLFHQDTSFTEEEA